jgi:hypothetical protein
MAHMRMRRVAVVAAVAFGMLTAGTVATGEPGPPPNDNYLQSFALNSAGKRLERKATLKDVRDTTDASVQDDVFSPPRQGGPPEVTRCGGTRYGKTIWYDFYPDVPGIVRIRANGYDAVISVVPFDRKTGKPNFGDRACVDDSSSTQEEMLTRVKKGGSYTIQLGGANDASGSLEFLFDFLADTDGDGVLDDVDRCPRVQGRGRPSGCPLRVHAEALIRARAVPGGIQVLGLSVTPTRASRVAVSCTRGCRTEVKRAKRANRRLRFRRIRGRRLPAGSKLVIRATRRRAFGAYIAYQIRDGNFTKVERCLRPGSPKPRRRCR